VTKQQRITLPTEYGWKTALQYRKTMDDIIITQCNKELGFERIIYLYNEDLDAIIDFLNNIKRTKVKK